MEYTGATAAKSKEDKGWQGWPRKDFREVLNTIILDTVFGCSLASSANQST
ncbi:MAG: hypothetical protein M3342_19930 [Bacteroidota bacterium]|nr:hypothetical protein [Bacteroidota bacterium]